MPKFFYTVIVVAGIFWILWSKYLISNAPETASNILIFLLLLLVALSHTVVIPIYVYYYKMAPDFTNLRRIYRLSFKWALFLSTGFVGYLGLKAFDIAKPVNLLLYFVLFIAVFLKLKK